jgi:putative intracellular protease/amidase
MQMSFTPTVERLARRMFPGQVPTKLVPPEPYEPDTFTLEGHELRIIEQGRTDSPDSTSLYVPSIGLIVAGDVVYNQCRMYVGDTTPESRKNWIAALDRLAALNPAMVVAGHKKPGAPDSPSTIQDTKRYLQDFDRLQKTAKSDQELFDQMTELYPHWVANQSWLMFGFPQAITRINRGSRSLGLGTGEQNGIVDFKKENKMTTKGKVLVLVSSGRGLPLKDGKVYTGAGYYLNELTVPVRALMKEGYEITFANPKGNTPQVDVHSEVADFFGGDAAKLQDYMLFRDGLTGLRDPTRISDVIASGLDQYDAVFVPGGHGPMIDLLDDPNAGIVMRHFHETSKPTAVLCHGPISLLSALPNSTELVAALAAGDAAGAHAKAQGLDLCWI